jgi:signal transduction histidine kinase
MQRILVIDDDPAVRQVVVRALRDQAFVVLTAENGIVGVEMAKSSLPDLVLCDVRMEQLDGYGTLEALRRDAATSTIPFILMTGQADYAGMRQGMELGADDYLPKPFTVPELVAAVRARLRKQGALREEADKRLESLRASISCALPHELRTPLNGILGFAEVLMTDASSLQPEDVGAMARAIHDSATRLHRIIENTLLYAQMELTAGHESKVHSLRQGWTPDIAATMAKAAQSQTESAGRTADLTCALESSGVAMSEEYLKRIAEELVDNAVKYSNPGTPIRVRTRVEGLEVVLSVSDAGRGMKPEHVAQIGAYMQFERRFYEQQGSGLGLTIAKRLAELHGGSLAVLSEPGHGTEVSVRLPTHQAR